MRKTTKTVLKVAACVAFITAVLIALVYLFVFVLLAILYGTGWMIWGM